MKNLKTLWIALVCRGISASWQASAVRWVETSLVFFIIHVEWRKMLPSVPSSQSRSEQHSEWNLGKLLYSASWQQIQKTYAISEVSSESSSLLSHTQHLVSLFRKLLQPQGHLGSFAELDRLRRRQSLKVVRFRHSSHPYLCTQSLWLQRQVGYPVHTKLGSYMLCCGNQAGKFLDTWNMRKCT